MKCSHQGCPLIRARGSVSSRGVLCAHADSSRHVPPSGHQTQLVCDLIEGVEEARGREGRTVGSCFVNAFCPCRAMLKTVCSVEDVEVLLSTGVESGIGDGDIADEIVDCLCKGWRECVLDHFAGRVRGLIEYYWLYRKRRQIVRECRSQIDCG